MEAVDAKTFEDKIKNIDAHPFLTELNDVECYFLNAAHIADLNPEITIKRAQELIDLATKQSEEASKSALITIRMDAAYKAKGANYNKGHVALKAVSDYDSDPTTWRRGKLTLNMLRQLLHTELKKNPILLERSPHLVTPALTAIKEAIWPTAEGK